MIAYCVRHAESAYNAEGRIQGQSDIPLSDRGRRQSEILAESLKDESPFECIYSSPLARAHETAEIVARKLDLEIRLDDRLKEINAGVFQGLNWDEIEQQYPQDGAKWRSGQPDFTIPQGESRRDLMRRGGEAFEAVRDAGHQRAMVVAHGGLLTAAFKYLLEVPAERNPFSLYNTSISLLQWRDQFRLLALNGVDHLLREDPSLVGHLGDL